MLSSFLLFLLCRLVIRIIRVCCCWWDSIVCMVFGKLVGCWLVCRL